MEIHFVILIILNSGENVVRHGNGKNQIDEGNRKQVYEGEIY